MKGKFADMLGLNQATTDSLGLGPASFASPTSMMKPNLFQSLHHKMKQKHPAYIKPSWKNINNMAANKGPKGQKDLSAELERLKEEL